MIDTSLRVLGPVELLGPAGAVPVPGAKARQILSVLALHAPGQVQVHQIVDLLWDEPPPSAVKTVQAHLSRLRSALRAAGAPEALVGTGTSYRLDLGDGLDVARARRLAALGHDALATGDASLAVTFLGQARERWRGEIEVPPTPAGDALRRRVADEKLALDIAFLGALIDSGTPEQAVAELGALSAAEPYNERVGMLRMTALYRSGRPTDALRAYHEFATRLAEETGSTPGTEMRALESTILAQQPTTGPGPTPARPRRPLGGDVSYTDRAGTHLAYRVWGHDGDAILLCSPGLVSVDALLGHPLPAAAIGRLAAQHRVIAFDPRGIGLSDRGQPPGSIDLADWARDAEAVLDAAGIGAAHVFASGHGGLSGITLAATRPDRVRSLLLMNAFARATPTHDYPHGLLPPMRDALESSLDATTAAKADALTLISPSVAADPAYREWWDDAGRRAASPSSAATLVAMMVDADVRDLVASVHAPTLVIVRTRCPAYDPGHSRWLARHLGEATLVEHDGVDDPWWVGQSDAVIAAIEAFVGTATT